MEFTSPYLNYAQLAPILIVLAGALIGVLIEAFAPRAARHSSQLFISIFSLVASFGALMMVRNQSSTDAAMGSVAFDGAGVLLQAAVLIIAMLSIFLISDQENFTPVAAAVPIARNFAPSDASAIERALDASAECKGSTKT